MSEITNPTTVAPVDTPVDTPADATEPAPVTNAESEEGESASEEESEEESDSGSDDDDSDEEDAGEASKTQSEATPTTEETATTEETVTPAPRSDEAKKGVAQKAKKGVAQKAKKGVAQKPKETVTPAAAKNPRRNRKKTNRNGKQIKQESNPQNTEDSKRGPNRQPQRKTTKTCQDSNQRNANQQIGGPLPRQTSFPVNRNGSFNPNNKETLNYRIPSAYELTKFAESKGSKDDSGHIMTNSAARLAREIAAYIYGSYCPEEFNHLSDLDNYVQEGTGHFGQTFAVFLKDANLRACGRPDRMPTGILGVAHALAQNLGSWKAKYDAHCPNCRRKHAKTENNSNGETSKIPDLDYFSLDSTDPTSYARFNICKQCIQFPGSQLKIDGKEISSTEKFKSIEDDIRAVAICYVKTSGAPQYIKTLYVDVHYPDGGIRKTVKVPIGSRIAEFTNGEWDTFFHSSLPKPSRPEYYKENLKADNNYAICNKGCCPAGRLEGYEFPENATLETILSELPRREKTGKLPQTRRGSSNRRASTWRTGKSPTRSESKDWNEDRERSQTASGSNSRTSSPKPLVSDGLTSEPSEIKSEPETVDAPVAEE